MTQAEFSWFDPTGQAVREWHKHGDTGEAIRRMFIAKFREHRERKAEGIEGRFLDAALEFRGRDVFSLIWNRNRQIEPSTPTRILRLMREDGMLDYQTVGARRESRYRILGVRVSETVTLGEIRPDWRATG